MLEQIHLLIRLQILDKTLFDLGQEKETIPGRLAALSQAEAACKAELDRNQDELDELLRRRRDLEEITDNIRARLRRTENRLMGAKTQREYQAANAEIDDNKDALKDNDDQLLEVMERQEKLEATVAALKERFAQASAEANEQRAVLDKRYLDLEAETGRLQAKRGEIVGQVEAPLLKEYDFIRQARDGVALSPVSQGICTVCHMGIPPQQYNELQRMDKIMTCPSCRRLIYWADAEEFAGQP
ncbi:MAG: hypothetical protein C4525_02445 [Desulfarculus sp.]|nr:MAG: hypothetical protein C4525_02445 [Desulfarculus sp.]